MTDLADAERREDWTKLKSLLAKMTGYPAPGWRKRLATGPNFDLDFIDVPTYHYLSAQVDHPDPKCSYVQTNGGMCCDCGAVEKHFHEYIRQRKRGAR